MEYVNQRKYRQREGVGYPVGGFADELGDIR